MANSRFVSQVFVLASLVLIRALPLHADPVTDLYEITSGTYTEVGGFVGVWTRDLPAVDQAFIELTINHTLNTVEMRILGKDLDTFEILDFGSPFTDGSLNGSLILFQGTVLGSFFGAPGTFDYSVVLNGDQISLQGDLSSQPMCCDIPYHFCHAGVEASLAWADDADRDGVNDAIDVCNNTPAGTAVDGEGRPLGDVDQDCDTDLEDYSLFRDFDTVLEDYYLFQQGFTGPLAPPVVIDTVTVGNPGNAGELSGEGAGGFGPDRICGAVDYTYDIGKLEVTAGQYAKFLNAVAATDTYGLYNPYMGIASRRGCQIMRNGEAGSYTYDFSGSFSGPETAWGDRPVNYVSWGDAARFANWLHNGQPIGAQDLTTTEDGSYYLDGATSYFDLLAVTREDDATWVIPSEDEWYKAAYHYTDGVTGNYWDYPTSSDDVPSNFANDPDPGNNASFNDIGYPYFRTKVGAHENSESPYNTFDQGGNVWEWNEAVVDDSYRGYRGGSTNSTADALHAAGRHSQNLSRQYSDIGFRVVKVP